MDKGGVLRRAKRRRRSLQRFWRWQRRRPALGHALLVVVASAFTYLVLTRVVFQLMS